MTIAPSTKARAVISCRNYEAAAEAIPGAIGLSGSTVSRAFIEASAAKPELQSGTVPRRRPGAGTARPAESTPPPPHPWLAAADPTFYHGGG